MTLELLRLSIVLIFAVLSSVRRYVVVLMVPRTNLVPRLGIPTSFELAQPGLNFSHAPIRS